MGRELRVRATLTNGESIEGNVVKLINERRVAVIMVKDKTIEVSINKVIFI